MSVEYRVAHLRRHDLREICIPSLKVQQSGAGERQIGLNNSFSSQVSETVLVLFASIYSKLLADSEICATNPHVLCSSHLCSRHSRAVAGALICL
eukprot:6180465-Pleurochrysis_carterae.AAC.1